MMQSIYVGNLNPNVNPQALTQLFEKYGRVVSAKIVKDHNTDTPKGFGFVSMESETDALNAIQHLNSVEFRGQKLKVDYAK